jgi:ABC-2 type transport system ATP-binding protein
MTYALEITDLVKTYATGTRALKGVSLAVTKGDFFALLGPNGAGKTSLIGIVCGLVNKTSGTVKINDISIDTDAERAKLHVGVVPQEFNFGIFENVIDIVINQAGYYGIPRTKAMPLAEKYLKLLGLWEKKDVQARTLSGGMKRRLMIARALVHEPTLLILDEPTAGVDIELRRGMWEFLTQLNNDGVTIILTTHYLEEAEQLCRNVAIINGGQIVEQGDMKKLLANMEKETIIFTLHDEREEEVTLTKTYTLHQAMLEMHAAGKIVKSVRNKTNRLEEFFVQKTNS